MKAKNFKYYLTVDPSINACGVAVHRVEDKKLIRHGLIANDPGESHKLEYIEKSRGVVKEIKNIMLDYDFVKIVTEVPEYWDKGGFIARESGSIFKLTFLCGMVVGLSQHAEAYTPSMWKRQLPKEVVRRRLMQTKEYKNIDIENMDHNTMDAVAIGYWLLHDKTWKTLK